MKRFKTGTWFILSFLLVFWVQTVVHGFTLSGLKWPNARYSYYVNGSNSDVGHSAAISAVKNGANVWSQWCPGSYAGTTLSKQVRLNSKNTVFFRNSSNGNAIATTYWWYSGSNLLDFDIVFWDAAWRFYTGSTACKSSGFYIFDIAAHEFGHAIGIGHSSVRTATMYPSVAHCSTTLRTLDPDDKNAANNLY